MRRETLQWVDLAASTLFVRWNAVYACMAQALKEAAGLGGAREPAPTVPKDPPPPQSADGDAEDKCVGLLHTWNGPWGEHAAVVSALEDLPLATPLDALPGGEHLPAELPRSWLKAASERLRNLPVLLVTFASLRRRGGSMCPARNREMDCVYGAEPQHL